MKKLILAKSQHSSINYSDEINLITICNYSQELITIKMENCLTDFSLI